MKRILTRANARVLLTSASRLDDVPKARALLQQIEQFGPLEASFIVAIVSK